MSDAIANPCPDEVLASIVWYPDRLDDARRGLVEAHLADCADCRAELAFVHGEDEPDLELPDADRVYASLLERIERHEGVGSRQIAARDRVPVQATPRRARASGGASRAAVAAGLAFALFVGGVGGLWLGGAEGPVYTAASEAGEGAEGAAAVASGPALDVVFRSDASADRIHSALRAIGGQVIAGPTQIGVYRIRLTAEADVAAAARVLRGEGQGVATFAEPTTDR